MSVAFIVATLLLSQISSHDIHLFFFIFFSLFKLFFHLFSKIKKKPLFLSISSHTYCYISSNFSLSVLPLYLPTTLSLYFVALFYNLPLLLPILFCINLILFSYSIHIFPIQNCEYSLSLYFLSMNFYSFL